MQYHKSVLFEQLASVILGMIALLVGVQTVRGQLRSRQTIAGLAPLYRPAARASRTMALVIGLWVTLAFLGAALTFVTSPKLAVTLAMSPIVLGLLLLPVAKSVISKHPTDPALEASTRNRMKRFL